MRVALSGPLSPACGQNVFPPEYRVRKIAFAGMPEMFLKGLSEMHPSCGLPNKVARQNARRYVVRFETVRKRPGYH